MLKNYSFSLILLSSVFFGLIFGNFFPEYSIWLKPLGDLYLNLLFTLVVPLIFFSLSSALANLNPNDEAINSILGKSLAVFLFTSLLAGIFGFLLVNFLDLKEFYISQSLPIEQSNNYSFLALIINSISVNDFSLLFSRKSTLALMLFAFLLGFGVFSLKEKAANIKNILSESNLVTQKLANIITTYFSPVGIFCYFAFMAASMAELFINSYCKIAILYAIGALIYAGLFFTIQAYLANKGQGVKLFWQNAANPILTALGTLSSAACIPVNRQALKNIGVKENIADIALPIGISLHKEGSVIGGVFKIAFLFAYYGQNIFTLNNFLMAILIAVLVGTIMGAIPGGGMVAEVFILNIYGFPQESLPLILAISAIIDAPATMLNSTANITSTMLISRLCGQKNLLLSSK